MDNEIKHIDLAKTIRERDSRLLKSLPPFVVRLLIRIIKQEEINSIINKYAGYPALEFLPKVIEEFNLQLDIEGIENLPENGKCFFVANHPFGILDGLILTYTVSQKYGSLKAIANDSFAFVPQLRPFVAAVNVFGRSSREYLNAINETYNSSEPITHFPAGIVSRLVEGKVRDLPWQKSFIAKAVSSQRDIVPFYFYGRNSRLFYAIFIFRRIFGIKTVIELMLLPREIFKKKHTTVKVTIGKPISYETFDKSRSNFEWAQKLRSHVYSLGTEKPGSVASDFNVTEASEN
ncbi:MAG: 1-acyl-sn-glycerol-3-phosphate acyltransferase [Marinilabiliaceae bacterium]|nr:1-acyl-sn-glycerol-3-phosphate acyltransferase [Marinilabiliaceae bacterium]